MTREQLLTVVESAVFEHINEHMPLTEYDRLTDLGLDSLSFVQVTIELEEKLNVVFPKNLSMFKTIGDVVHFVEQQQQCKHS